MSSMMTAMKDSDSPGNAGRVKIDTSTEPPTLIARAVIFPVLVQEIFKGVMEFLALRGLPEDEDLRQQVLDKADFLDAELWDIRLGPQLWTKFLAAINAAGDNFNERDIKSVLTSEVMGMPAPEFNAFMKELLSGSSKGVAKLKMLAKEIRDDLRREDAEDALGTEL